MQVVLLEQLSSSHDQQACFEPLFLLQKTLICDIICLRVAHAVRRLCAHPPHAVDGCLPAPRRRAPAPTNRFGSASSTARSAPAGPQGTGWSLCQPLSLGWRGGCCRGLRSWHGECHLRNLCTAFQDVAQTCLLSPYLRKCARAAGLLGWGRCVCMEFADMQLYSVFRAGRTSASSEPGASLLGWILHRANHSYTAPGSLLAWIHPDSETE